MDYMKEMLKLQDSFNEKTSENWKEKNYDWVNYIMIESAEQNASLDFKHWKSGEDDMDNFKVEVIDNWHFLMSLLLEKYSISYLTTLMNEIWKESSEDFQEIDFQNATQYFSYKVLASKFDNFEDNVFEAVFVLFTIMQQLEILTVEELYREYIVKNTLNSIRQHNGYRDGSYIKMWTKSDGKQYEDNVIAYEMASSIDDLTMETLYSALDKFYKGM